MALLNVNWDPGDRELRQFALLWIVFFGLIGAYLAWGAESMTPTLVLWAIAAIGAVGLFLPSLMDPIYTLWMMLAFPIGWLISHVLLLSIFYLVLTPIGLVMRLFGYDPMKLQFDRAAKSYWVPHDPEADPARYFKQY